MEWTTIAADADGNTAVALVPGGLLFCETRRASTTDRMAPAVALAFVPMDTARARRFVEDKKVASWEY